MTLTAIVLGGVGSPAPWAAAEDSSSAYVVTNPEAARQPTERGRRIHALKAWQGRLYSGYGDYGANTGPIAITSFDPATKAFSVEFIQDTEEIGRFREIGDALYAPAIDPRCCSDFAVRTAGSAWGQRDVASTYHVYDIVGGAGSGLFMSGSTTGACNLSCGAVWTSSDGGINWVRSFTEVGEGAFRCFNLVSFQSKIYVECTSGRYVLSGGSWSVAAIDLVHPEAVIFDQRLITIGDGAVFSWDGSSRKDLNRKATALTTADGRLFAFYNGTVYSTSDLDAQQCSFLSQWFGGRCTTGPIWSSVGTYPSSASSVAVLGGYAYSGGADGTIYRSGGRLY